MHERNRRPPTEMPDDALMALYADGDEGAFDELFRRYECRAYAYFVARTGSPERADDLYQELFLRVHRARDRFDRKRPFAPWFFQIARRLLIDDQRRAHRSYEVPIEDRELRSDYASSEKRVGDREGLGQALASLSREERYILVSSKLAGVGYPELAMQLGKSVAAVRKAASRALRRLRTASLVVAPLPTEGR